VTCLSRRVTLKNNHSKKKKVVVFAPHPDDETFGCGGTIAKKIREGYEIIVVVITDGRNAFRIVLGINSEPTPYELREIRRSEAERAIGILGVPKENIFFLDFEDGTLHDNEQKAEDIVTGILAENCPDEIYLPYKNECNPDHQTTNKIVKDSIRKLCAFNSTYQYTIAQRHSQVASILNALSNLWKHNMIYVDISDFLDAKKRAIKEYESQVAIISGRQSRPIMENVHIFLKKKEVFFVD